MPAVTTLVMTDRATTPVAHTFEPIGFNKDDGVWTLRKQGVSDISAPIFTISQRKSAGKWKSRMVLKYPVVQNETVNGIVNPKTVRTGFGEISFTFAENASEQEKKDVVGMLQSALDAAKVLVNDTVVKSQFIY